MVTVATSTNMIDSLDFNPERLDKNSKQQLNGMAIDCQTSPSLDSLHSNEIGTASQTSNASYSSHSNESGITSCDGDDTTSCNDDSIGSTNPFIDNQNATVVVR